MQTDLQQKRLAYCTNLQNALQRILKILESMLEVEKVILFGSYASSQSDLFTDLDLLVVMDSKKDFVALTAELYQTLHAGVDLDLLVYTPEEFEFMRNKPFIGQAVKTGKVLYEKRCQK